MKQEVVELEEAVLEDPEANLKDACVKELLGAAYKAHTVILSHDTVKAMAVELPWNGMIVHRSIFVQREVKTMHGLKTYLIAHPSLFTLQIQLLPSLLFNNQFHHGLLLMTLHSLQGKPTSRTL